MSDTAKLSDIRDVLGYLEDAKHRAQILWAFSPNHYMALVGVPLGIYLTQCDKAIKIWKELEHAESLRTNERQVQSAGNERQGSEG